MICHYRHSAAFVRHRRQSAAGSGTASCLIWGLLQLRYRRDFLLFPSRLCDWEIGPWPDGGAESSIQDGRSRGLVCRIDGSTVNYSKTAPLAPRIQPGRQKCVPMIPRYRRNCSALGLDPSQINAITVLIIEMVISSPTLESKQAGLRAALRAATRPSAPDRHGVCLVRTLPFTRH